MATVQFLGAAQEVTGSCHLLESAASGRILLDCGMHQGDDAVDRLMSERFAFDPAGIDAVVLSHAHLDHSGLLPKLVHEGFSGPIYCTRASADLLQVMLKDSAGLYQRDLERENLRRRRKGQKLLKPAYSRGDVKRVFELCRGSAYRESVALGADASLTFHDAGHILGSAIVELSLQEKGQRKTLVFSGDLGKRDAALMNDPSILEHADVLLMESTYGDRDHRPMDHTLEELEEILTATWNRGGNIMIPAFAVGRTQELLFYLGQLRHRGRLDNWEVILDSPMAIEVTQVYNRWVQTLDDEDIRSLHSEDRAALENFLPGLRLTPTTEESMAINRIKKGAIIIAGSGMCTGGRIRHHFKQRIWNKRNTIIFVGFQARDTLGRILVDGARRIRLFREDYVVRAEIATLGGFSAHAGKSELLEWLAHFKGQPRVALVHGEPQALDALSRSLWEQQQIDALIPAIGDSLAF